MKFCYWNKNNLIKFKKNLKVFKNFDHFGKTFYATENNSNILSKVTETIILRPRQKYKKLWYKIKQICETNKSKTVEQNVNKRIDDKKVIQKKFQVDYVILPTGNITQNKRGTKIEP